MPSGSSGSENGDNDDDDDDDDDNDLFVFAKREFEAQYQFDIECKGCTLNITQDIGEKRFCVSEIPGEHKNGHQVQKHGRPLNVDDIVAGLEWRYTTM